MRVELQQIDKSFGSLKALDRVDLTVESGSIHGLVGENGAGKSTLMKILTGYQSPSGGVILLDGKQVSYSDPAQAAEMGIGMLYQEPQDFPVLSVLENFMVGRDSAADGNRSRQWSRLDGLATSVHFHFDSGQRVEKLTVGERQQLEFLRLLGRNARVLILDEPTTGISDRQKDRLFDALRQIRDEGRTIILVSHKLEEVEALCDRVSILRAGKMVGEEDAPFHIPKLLQLMFEQHSPEQGERRPHLPAEPLISFTDISAKGERTGLTDCSVTIHRGEMVGLAGLSGSGQGVFLRLAAALAHPVTGTINYHGLDLKRRNHQAFRQAGGAFLPADRLHEGLISGFTIEEHFTLAGMGGGEEALQAIEQFRIQGRPESPAESLSGGNQQRLQLSLIPRGADLILLENPTRGLDVASGQWVWEYLRTHYGSQGAVVFSSAELDEILAVADRVLVFFDGKIVSDLSGDNLDYQHIAAAMTGHQHEV